MAAVIDRAALQKGIAALAEAMEREAATLNAADARLGDGDLGVTMQRGMRLVCEVSENLPDDLGRAFMACAQAFTRSSGSSYGTLLATGLMAVAKEVKGQDSVPAARTSQLVAIARDAMSARGKAGLGAKTVLDSLDAISRATESLDDHRAIADAAAKAVDEALDVFRDRPAQIGRARIFAERSMGLDDPGMLAMSKMVHALAGPAR